MSYLHYFLFLPEYFKIRDMNLNKYLVLNFELPLLFLIPSTNTLRLRRSLKDDKSRRRYYMILSYVGLYLLSQDLPIVPF